MACNGLATLDTPSKNNVVLETLKKTKQYAEKLGQNTIAVSYDLSVAIKAYSIQALEGPEFDNIIILLGNFHLELSFYGAIGTYLNEGGAEFILTESNVLSGVSLMGFLRGTFYNRCTCGNELLATAMEALLFEKFVTTLSEDDNSFR